jgi:hypothetical protein
LTDLEVPRSLREKTDSYLELSRRNLVEVLVLWSSESGSEVSRVREVWLPKQEAGSGFFYVPEGELFKINKELFSHKQTLVAQVHTHPSLAFHSEVDDEFAIVSHEGAYSIVVPHFGGTSVADFERCAYYHRECSSWRRLDRTEAKSRINFEL